MTVQQLSPEPHLGQRGREVQRFGTLRLLPIALSRGLQPPRYPTLFEACANAIVFQQLSLYSASAIMRRLVLAFGTTVDHGGVPLTPLSGRGGVPWGRGRCISHHGPECCEARDASARR